MAAVTIHDLRVLNGGRVLAFDLIDILRLCETRTKNSSWRIANVESLGALADELHQASESQAPVSGPDLLRISAGVHQIIDGDFEGFEVPAPLPWLIVRAVDSTFYVVVTRDQTLLAAIRGRFADVRDSPMDAADVA